MVVVFLNSNNATNQQQIAFTLQRDILLFVKAICFVTPILVKFRFYAFLAEYKN